MNKKNTDNRMQWITTLEENDPKERKYSTNYEFFSEVRIPGILEYNNGNLLCGLIEEDKEQGLYYYRLILTTNEKEYKFDLTKYSKAGYFFSSGIIGELLAIFSVYFQARFFLKSSTYGELTNHSIEHRISKKTNYIKPSPYKNFEMFSNETKRNWNKGLTKFLDDIKSLDQIYHQNLINSFHWYAEAIKHISIDRELFYVRMVSSIESLLNYIEPKKDSLTNKLEVLTTDNITFNEDEKIQINNWIKNRNIQNKFINFTETYSEGFFKDGNEEANHCYIKSVDLKKHLKSIYSARSKYLHEGKPMYISDDYTMDDAKCWDIDPAGGMFVDRKKFSQNEKLPRMRWFERIVNYSIKKFIEKNLNKKL
ncbi:MAG: hypothetical protein COX80_03730 [Candidatus Magasanikbacteria bacterium CG_4_10_14_0_2_um_filter_33_14]|uniref:Apea-like HEPN domain-containing protein n=1 Tax=Candidatus Magasanikbacteria bacterium CG_4_10_14_0_2_um_filter_33_14 TaxID=1974636 RepID=A0A2M7VA24_9BACT|nr:MAG: hypothetical protein COX80_03730 [Candidatus Magasanikbacteria bacterium CG_4_10_14_0_2_um_filter_33_14]